MFSMRLALIILAATAGFIAAQQPAADDQASNDRLILEVVKRVRGFEIEKASPKVKDAVGRYLAGSRGSKEYFDFVERFQVKSEKPHLLDMAQKQSGTVNGSSAFKALAKIGEVEAIQQVVLSADPQRAGALLDTLALSQSREAAAVILQCVTEAKASVDLKQAALKSLGKSRNGENLLLQAARENKLPAELKLAAGSVLHDSQDPKIREEAAKLLPMPASVDNKPLPPLAQLVKLNGNAQKGLPVFQKLCMTCHKLGDQGIEFGPSLAEIGSKLAREALYQSILDPSAGVSFGFEGFEVKTKGGDTYIGMVVGETDAELSLRVPGGVVVKTPKSAVASRTKLAASLMTPNLQSAMTQQELVDLVEFLSILKKK